MQLEPIIQGALAAILLIGMIAVCVVELIKGEPISIPDALTLAVGAVVGYFYGQRSAPVTQENKTTVRVVHEDVPKP